MEITLMSTSPRKLPHSKKDPAFHSRACHGNDRRTLHPRCLFVTLFLSLEKLMSSRDRDVDVDVDGVEEGRE